MLARTWPFILIVLLQFLPIIFFNDTLLPSAVGFLVFFLIGFIPVMIIFAFISVYSKHFGYSKQAIAIIASFYVAWVLSSAVPFV